MTKEGSTKILNFMTPRAGDLVIGSGHVGHIVNSIDKCILGASVINFELLKTVVVNII